MLCHRRVCRCCCLAGIRDAFQASGAARVNRCLELCEGVSGASWQIVDAGVALGKLGLLVARAGFDADVTFSLVDGEGGVRAARWSAVFLTLGNLGCGRFRVGTDSFTASGEGQGQQGNGQKAR